MKRSEALESLRRRYVKLNEFEGAFRSLAEVLYSIRLLVLFSESLEITLNLVL